MPNLKTTYMGIELSSPIVVAASSISSFIDRIKLAASKADAEAGTAITLDGSVAVGTAHSLTGYHIHLFSYEEAPLEFKVADAVETAGEGTIDFGYAHGLATGDAVVYRTDPSFQREISLNRGTQFRLAESTVTFNPGSTTGDGEAVIDADGKTIVLVTHEKYIADYSRRIISLRDGEVVDAGSGVLR